MRPRQNGCLFPDDIFKCIFLNESIWISIEISLKLVPKGPINNIPALVQIMAWRRSGNKPFSEPMLVCLLTHICITRPQWVKLNASLDHITVISHESHGILDHQLLECLFNNLFGWKPERNIKGPHNWPFVKGIHQYLVDSPHKRLMMQKVFPYYYVIMRLVKMIVACLENIISHCEGKPLGHISI